MKPLSYLGTILLGIAVLSPLQAEDKIEPLVVGKEGRSYSYKKLFRRGEDSYKTFTIKQQQVHIAQTPVKDKNVLQFLPDFSQAANILSDFQEYAANDFVELYFEMEGFPATADTLYILNRLLQMKTMTGIPYFSTRQQKMTTYITSCYLVETAKSRKELPSLQFSELPTEPIHFVIRQDDNRFTPTWYDVTIRMGEDGSLRMTMENITPMFVQFIFYFKALDAHKVRHEIVILPNTKRKPEVYALSQIYNERTEVLGIKLDLGNSFNRRMSAIQGWISTRIYH